VREFPAQFAGNPLSVPGLPDRMRPDDPLTVWRSLHHSGADDMMKV
jgi:hypothetical protein